MRHPGCKIIEIDLAGDPKRRWTFDQPVTALGLCESGSLVVALAREVSVFNPDTGIGVPLAMRYRRTDDHAAQRWKGRARRRILGRQHGRPTAARSHRPTSTASDSDGTAQVIAGDIEVSNGLAWSPDGRRLYHSDFARALDRPLRFRSGHGRPQPTGRASPTSTEATGRPDGAACDAAGGYWSAGVSAGVLNRFTSDGHLQSAYPFPAPAPTMPCFCGPGLRQIAVTTHRLVEQMRLQPAPQSGGVFLAEAPVAGAPVARMKGI